MPPPHFPSWPVSISGLFSGPQVMILITGAHKAFALYKAIEEGVNHMWTVSAFQQHPRTVFVCDEDATLELKVKTVKYFKGEAQARAGGREGGVGLAFWVLFHFYVFESRSHCVSLAELELALKILSAGTKCV